VNTEWSETKKESSRKVALAVLGAGTLILAGLYLLWVKPDTSAAQLKRVGLSPQDFIVQ